MKNMVRGCGCDPLGGGGTYIGSVCVVEISREIDKVVNHGIIRVVSR